MKLFGNSKSGKWVAKKQSYSFDENPEETFSPEPTASEEDVEPIIRSVISKTQEDLTADQPVAVRGPKRTLPEEPMQSEPLHSQTTIVADDKMYDNGYEAGSGMAGWVKGLLLLAACLAVFLFIYLMVRNQLMTNLAVAKIGLFFG